MDGVDNKYIGEAIDNLIRTIGIKKNVPYEELVDLFKKNKIKECIKSIASYLGLPIEINLSYVSANYSSSSGSSQNRFESQKLVKVGKSGQGVEGITAQVSIPSYIPMYGTSALINFPIDVKISENAREYSGVFIGILAHELSHVLLHSLRHPQKDNEFYTDITAMLLGFNDVMEFSRKTEKVETTGNITTTHTTTYGYLSNDNFYYAYYRINNLYDSFYEDRAKLLSKIIKDRKLIKNTKRLYGVMKENFSYISENLSTIKIRGKSSEQFVKMQNFLYQCQDFEKELFLKEERLAVIYNAVMSKKIYCPDKDREFEDWERELSTKHGEIKEHRNFFKKSIMAQIKYIKISKKIASFIALVGA